MTPRYRIQRASAVLGLLAACGLLCLNPACDRGAETTPDHRDAAEQDDARLVGDRASQPHPPDHPPAPADLNGTGEAHDHDHGEEHDHDHAGEGEHSAVEIPPRVRQNLGITFVKIEERPVRSTLRLAGQFELRPEARRDYHAMLPARVDLQVRQFQSVQPGDLLYTLDSPEWRRVQSKLAHAYRTCFCHLPELDAARAALQENQARIEFLEKRLGNLAEAGTRNAELETELAAARMSTPRLEAEVRAREADRVSGQLTYNVLLNEASSLTGLPLEDLDSSDHTVTDTNTLNEPGWARVDRIVVKAEAPGVVDRIEVTDQGWAETGDLILTTIDPSVLRFHADALQTDINRLSDDMPARIVPPPGGSIDLQDTTDGWIDIGFQAHPDQRTVPIYVVPEDLPHWAKSGVTAYLEVFTRGSIDAVPAVPEAAVVRDGLDKIFFLRDPQNPDRALRMTADLGTSDGRWVQINNHVHVGDEVVLGGVYPLMLATSESGERQEGGHFHADGTFHETEY